MNRYGRNIGLNYLFTALSTLNLTHGIWMIYLALKGFSLVELGILEGIYHVTSFLMEVPTGVIADLWGRKLSRILGRIAAVLSVAIMFFSSGFLLQALGFILTALGNNLESGAGDALVYDSLLLDEKQDIYIQVAGKQELCYQIAAIASFLLGGYLAVHSYKWVFSLTMGFYVLGACLALLFIEPEIERVTTKNLEASLSKKIGLSMQSQMKESFLLLKSRKRIAFFIVFSESLFCFLTVLFFYLQNFWVSGGKTEFQIGIVFAANALVAGLTALFAGKIERKIGERGVLTSMPLLLIICLWGVALGTYQEFFYVLTGCIEGILIASIGTYLNRLIPSAQRATILSLQSMAFSFFMILIFPIAGAIGDHWSLQLAFLLMAILATLLCVAYLWAFKPYTIQKQGIALE
ncbi:major facilitator superfamily permease [Sphaerochaeta pleomorpha str. Grapes]|uniref:Major facilitator superfamily permease n=1 Tax=Sphaerochaeta pleomorpha (strain ATCC BAA-1885 / DSM 22778 / Grapes) TaxID=158190 RepID=G8QSD8_SPHPG|nr:MFS transporter [Sphaerochaeta pleomorpha]AEV30068.1 major facilitator superfamily permease [Sphaerochaeta pleomorpha str. Grapes]